MSEQAPRVSKEPLVSKNPTSHLAYMGWDIGGANLKAVGIGGDANASISIASVIEPLPLWQDKRLLAQVLERVYGELCSRLGIPIGIQAANRKPNPVSPASTPPVRHLVAMSGESADGFANRSEGVLFIANIAQRVLGECEFYGFGGVAKSVKANPLEFASANWHSVATALRMAGKTKGVWIDIGSTTTDIIPLHRPPEAADDATRLQNGSLVYGGVIRTSLMAVAIGRNVVAEHFADMGDVYEVLGIALPSTPPQSGATQSGADGKPRGNFTNAATRLLRMVGRDYTPSLKPQALELAREFQQSFENRLVQAFPSVSTLVGETVITSGVGSFIAEAWIKQGGIRKGGIRQRGLEHKSVGEVLLSSEVLLAPKPPNKQSAKDSTKDFTKPSAAGLPHPDAVQEATLNAPALALAWLANRHTSSATF